MFSSLFAALALSLAAGQALDPRAELVGAWRIQEEIDTRADGSVISVIPQGYVGIVVYTSDGFVSGTLMPRARGWVVGSATADQMRETLETGTAYTGRYEVDPKSHTVTHVIVSSMDPSDEGQRLSRTYVLDGDALALSGKWSYRNESLGFTIKFTRVKPEP